ncbi:PP2C family protein-serine/threonine phosphatase [Leptospira perolatii]|nr:SpoIIE family protein phosphatase [Leptospira perolatii]
MELEEQDLTQSDGFAFYLPASATGAVLLINGNFIASTRELIEGKLPPINAKPQIVSVPKTLLHSGKNRIDIRLSSLDFASAFEGFVYFGQRSKIQHLYLIRNMKTIAVSAIQIFLFLYFLFIYSQRKQEIFYLYFALLNLTLSIWLLAFKGHILYLLDARASYVICAFFIGSLPTVFLYEFFKHFLPIRRTKVSMVFEGFFLLCALFSLVEYIATGTIYFYYRYVFELFINALILFLFYILFRITKDYILVSKNISYGLLVGVGVFFTAIAHDIAIFLNAIVSESIINDGFFGMSLAFSFVLAKRYSDTYNNLEATQASLKALNESLETKVIERTRTIVAQKAVIEAKTKLLERDLAIAAKIQAALLPSDLPNIANVRVSFRYVPMLDVGGDFIDAITDRTGRALGIFICDVTGHGVGAAMLASMAKMALSDWSDYLSDPGFMLTKLRTQLLGKLNGNFLTATIATLYPESGRLLLANAGHPASVILRKNYTQPELLRPSGIAINEAIMTPYTTQETMLGLGDKMILYTDGFFEARDKNGTFFGEERLFSVFTENSHLKPDPFCSEVIESIRRFTNEKDAVQDDMALVVLEYLGKPGRE